jgi:hypothetical protein
VVLIPCPRPAIDPRLTTVPPFPPVPLSMYFRAVRVPWITPFCNHSSNYQLQGHKTCDRNLKNA